MHLRYSFRRQVGHSVYQYLFCNETPELAEPERQESEAEAGIRFQPVLPKRMPQLDLRTDHKIGEYNSCCLQPCSIGYEVTQHRGRLESSYALIQTCL